AARLAQVSCAAAAARGACGADFYRASRPPPPNAAEMLYFLQQLLPVSYLNESIVVICAAINAVFPRKDLFWQKILHNMQQFCSAAGLSVQMLHFIQ
ncbi:MAG: hypothetical protein J7639_01805, partial [Paenibacillaceae bacterium]|nr:hypothetical protein [Paenibacillaceae bacterium]